MDFAELNWIAILVSAGSAFALGGLWYGPLFGKSWQRRVGLSDEALAEANMALVFGVSFLLTLVISVGLALRGAGSFSADRVLQLRLASQANFGRG